MRKDRSRKAVLWYICQFSLGRMIGDHAYAGFSTFRETRAPAVGSLVALQSMRVHDFYLGWVHDVTQGTNGFDTVYAVESLETGEIINWSNVSVLEYDRSEVDAYPEWRWADQQWELKDLWEIVCYKERDAYIVLPCTPDFDGEAVTLSTRIRFGMGDAPAPKRFDDWRKVRKADMLEYFDAAVAEHEARRPAQSA